MEPKNNYLLKEKENKIPFALWEKKTGRILFVAPVAAFTDFAANALNLEKELKDEKIADKKIVFTMANTCDLGKTKLKYEQSEDAMKLLDMIGISRGSLENSDGWKNSLRDKTNIYDEYGIYECSYIKIVGNIVSGLYQLNSNANKQVNKNLDLSYGGYRDYDNQSTVSNDFWHRFYGKIANDPQYEWIKFYRNLNMTLRDNEQGLKYNLFCHSVLTTALSNGNVETLRKKIFDFGHFVGPDSYIYDFNKIYSNDDINKYKNYLRFILWNKLPDEKAKKADYAREILNYISGKNDKFKKFITENQVQYNDEDGRFEMTMDRKNIHDANAWLYSTFFQVLDKNCTRYIFYRSQFESKLKTLEKQGIVDYLSALKIKIGDHIKKSSEYSFEEDESDDEDPYESKYQEIALKVTKSKAWKKDNFSFIENTVKYFKRDFNFEDVVIFNELEKEKLKKDLEYKSIDSLLKRFFENPDEVKECLEYNEREDEWEAGRFENMYNNCLSNEGKESADIIFDNIKETSIAKKYNRIRIMDRIMDNVKYGFARSLFECLQVNGDYDKFIDELRINLSFYIRNDIGSVLRPDKMKLKTEFRQKFLRLKTEIQELKAKYNSKFQEYMKSHSNKKIDTKDSEYQKITAINQRAEEKQKEMDKDFFSVKQFNFLKEKKIIDENDFAQTNSKALEIAKNKISALNEEKELKNRIYNRFEDTVKNYTDISYEEFVAYLNKEICVCKYNGLEETLFNMIWEFDLELKNNKIEKIYSSSLVSNYWDKMVVMRLYHLVQHFFHTAGILSDVNELQKDEMRELALNMEDIKFYLKTNPNKLIVDENKNSIENLIIRLFKGTSLEKNILNYIGWFKSGINDFCQMTTNVIHITQLNGVSLATKNRKLENGFFVNCGNGLIKLFFVPLQRLAELSKKEFKPLIKSYVKLVDPKDTCNLTLNNDKWEILDKEQIFELSDKSFDILVNTATYITPEHLKKLMDSWQSNNYVETMEKHLLNTEAEESIFGLINRGRYENDNSEDRYYGNKYKEELFPMIKELYKNCKRTSLANAIEFLKMQKKCNYDSVTGIKLEDAREHFDFAVESINKIYFNPCQLDIYGKCYSKYGDLLKELESILHDEFCCRLDDGEHAENAREEAMKSHPELILALYILYYFGTKKYGINDNSKNELRNIMDYEKEIFTFNNWTGFLDSIEDKKYNREHKYLKKMAKDFFDKARKKDKTINRVIHNYVKHKVFSSKAINQEKEVEKYYLDSFNYKKNNAKNGSDCNSEEPLNENSLRYQNEICVNEACDDQIEIDKNEACITNEKCAQINPESKIKKIEDNRTRNTIVLAVVAVLILLLLICAIISMNPVFIKSMIFVSLIYSTLIIILICYRVTLQKTKHKIGLCLTKICKDMDIVEKRIKV